MLKNIVIKKDGGIELKNFEKSEFNNSDLNFKNSTNQSQTNLEKLMKELDQNFQKLNIKPQADLSAIGNNATEGFNESNVKNNEALDINNMNAYDPTTDAFMNRSVTGDFDNFNLINSQLSCIGANPKHLRCSLVSINIIQWLLVSKLS